jgi:8-oxo-dGTP pyrophosphatase MutT (NUDIX family)
MARDLQPTIVLATEAVAEELRVALIRRGMDQAALRELLEEAGHPISRAALARRLSGEHAMSVDEVAHVAHALGLQVHLSLSDTEGDPPAATTA